jgi:hypothetical protein
MSITFEPFDHSPTSLRVLVSPGAGRLRYLPPLRFAGGRELVEAGQPVARVLQGSGEIILRAPVGGVVSSILGIEGEPLVAGQAILAIEPETVAEPEAS